MAKIMSTDFDISVNVKKKSAEYFDISTFLLTVLLVTIGLISIYSATYEAGMSSKFTQQLTYSIIGMLLLIFIIFIPERWIFDLSNILYVLSLLSLVALYFFGREVSGTKGWLSLGFATFQPAEFAKLSTILAASRYLSSKGTDIRNLRDLLVVAIIVITPATLIYFQPDHGTASTFAAILLGLVFWAGFDLFILFTIVSFPVIMLAGLFSTTAYIVVSVVFSVIAILFRKKIYITILAIIIALVVGYSGKVLVNKLEPYQQKRIETFLNPGSDVKGSGYNVIQSILAVGNGGLSGTGFMNGTQTRLKYIPAQWTDFIFSVPSEEFGFIGATGVILLMVMFLIRTVKIAFESSSGFYSLIAFGVCSLFFYHIIINIGMVIGIMPVMGIPLPFMSSGGSFLVVNLIFVGLLLNAHRTQRRKKLV